MAVDILDELKSIVAILDRNGIEYALCGGLAMAVYALPRATLDIDLMIEVDALDRTRDAIRAAGYVMDALPMEFRNGKVRIHRVSKVDPDSGEILSLDLLMVTPETRKAWEGRVKVEWGGGVLHVVSPDGLIALKTLRGSGQDLDDIGYLRSITDED